MKKWITLILILLSIDSYCKNNSSELITTAGGIFKTNQIELSWSIGEVVLESFTNPYNLFLQGFQQPLQRPYTGLVELPESPISVYPNPMINFFNIYVENKSNSIISFTIYDIQGKIIMKKDNFEVKNSVDVQQLVNGLYLLKLFVVDNTDCKPILIQKKN